MAFELGNSVIVNSDATKTKQTVDEVEKNAMGQNLYIIDPPLKVDRRLF